ncbi:MAG: hypothetical protein JWO48_616 [Bryobacterales bacterium]|nr:hypothetical protein [Bryobacterales bacterium]
MIAARNLHLVLVIRVMILAISTTALSSPASCQEAAEPNSAAPNTGIPTWSSSFTYGFNSYKYTMVGTDPNLIGSFNTVIPTIIYPIVLTFSDGTVFNPTTASNGASLSALNSVRASPLFQSVPFFSGNVYLGTTQYIDAFQRANFWNHIDSLHNFHVKLQNPPIVFTLNRTLSSTDGYTTTDTSGKKSGHVDWVFLNAQISPFLTFGQPNYLHIFLLYNVSIYNYRNRGPSHTAGGYHSAFPGYLGKVTYIVADYTDAKDVSPLSHELGEWMDDPVGGNIVPAWSGGQVTGSCSTALEVGDPLSGTRFQVTLNGHTFHLQDLAFLSWFARRSPSSSVNGWYSFRNTLAGPPPLCH